MSLDIEAATWDVERIKDEINLRLVSGWVFKEASITLEEVELWSGEGLTAQLVLLDALGWLENRLYQVRDVGPWVRRQGELSPQRVHDIAYSKSYGPSDPPHLDPDEIESIARKGK
jgi:flavin reductase (DIM6/NTAB) family NADH-FMN oxidoreductase RutF